RKRMRRVVVFGIFDGVHEGHRSLFLQAREQGKELVAIVGRDEACLRWKGRKPRHSEGERLELVSKELLVDRAVLGDEEQSTYGVIESLVPDAVCLGYDQEDLERDVKAWMARNGRNIPLIRLKPFKPELYHNSHLQKGF
ncbi:MAG: adenylyltransferase/cytidyltransferase family protein, partial [bacterium]|nr:adenylyltransferase/cytidyltransferase family protein [bacterium]